jgi:hypothetical protein
MSGDPYEMTGNRKRHSPCFRASSSTSQTASATAALLPIHSSWRFGRAIRPGIGVKETRIRHAVEESRSPDGGERIERSAAGCVNQQRETVNKSVWCSGVGPDFEERNSTKRRRVGHYATTSLAGLPHIGHCPHFLLAPWTHKSAIHFAPTSGSQEFRTRLVFVFKWTPNPHDEAHHSPVGSRCSRPASAPSPRVQELCYAPCKWDKCVVDYITKAWHNALQRQWSGAME